MIRQTRNLLLAGGLFFLSLMAGGQAFAQEAATSSGSQRPASPTLEIRFPNGGSIACPLREIRTNVLIFFSSSDLNTDPGEECLRIVAELERQQNIQDLRAVLYNMQGKTQEEYQRALADFLLGRIGVPASRIAEVRMRIDSRDFLEWSDAEIIKFLNERYERNTQILRRIRDVRLRNPGALPGTP